MGVRKTTREKRREGSGFDGFDGHLWGVIFFGLRGRDVRYADFFFFFFNGEYNQGMTRITYDEYPCGGLARVEPLRGRRGLRDVPITWPSRNRVPARCTNSR